MNIDILLKNIGAADILVLNIHILVLSINMSQTKYGTLSYKDIPPDILNIDILS